MTDRRHFLRILSTVAASPIAAWAARSPIKLAHREGNMLRESSPYVYELAASIPTPHASPEACVEDTKKNVAFVMKYLS